MADIATLKILKEAAETGVAIADGMVTGQSSRVGRIFYAFAPEFAVNWVQGRRFRLTRIKLQEDIFQSLCKSVLDDYKKRSQKYLSSPKRQQNPLLRSMQEEMEEDLRLLYTMQCALSTLPSDQESHHATDHDACQSEDDISWWGIFEEFAKRRNASWRTDLLARALVQNELEPSSISLKALWEIGLMEADDFGLLSVFCNSALYVDGKPLIMIDPEEQVRFEMEMEDGLRIVNLAHAISALIDLNLVQQSGTLFDTSSPVALEYCSGPSVLRHRPPEMKSAEQSAIRIDSFCPTDHAMDICRLYQPKFNEASDASYSLFKSLLQDQSAEDGFGSVVFTET